MLFLKRNENILQLTADDVNFLSQPKHADEMCDHKLVNCSVQVGKVQAGQRVCKTETVHNFVTWAALCVRAPSRSARSHV